MGTFDPGRYREQFRRELFDRVLPFWLRHSLDREHGGYFTCLDRDGAVYDTTKYMWLQSRQVWMLSRLCNTVERRPEWVEAARLGAEFITRHGRDRQSGRVFFSLTREGRPLSIQRKIFSEVFYVMALDEYSRLSGEQRLRAEAEEVHEKVLAWSRDPSALGRPLLPGQQPMRQLAVPMSLLWMAEQLGRGRNEQRYERDQDRAVEEILLHRHEPDRTVYEHVAPDGSLLEGSLGRLLNPGHAIEAGWCVLDRARITGDERAARQAVELIDWSFQKGWDRELGGIFYFLDAGGFSPTQLEWPMKLWWPHCEAIYALLDAYAFTGEERFARDFETVVDYAWSHFPDSEYGEWFGYLDRRGEPTHRFKGGPYKGCFHVPRFLLMTLQLLDRLAD